MKKLITNCIPCYRTDEAQLIYASRYWNGKIDAVSLCLALRRAMEDDECPESVDPFESFVDANLYATPIACGQIWNPKSKKYDFIEK